MRKSIARTFAGLALTTGIVIGGATPAFALDNEPAPQEKKSCKGPDGDMYTHGSTWVSYIELDGEKHTASTYKCNDGEWEKVEKAVVRPGVIDEVVSAPGAPQGTVGVVRAVAVRAVR